ncbi:Reticulon-like protein B2 [Linum perenne]
MTDAVLDQLGTEVVMQEVIEKEQTPLPPPIAADDSYVDHDINLTATAAAAAAASSGDSSSNSSDSEIDNYIIMAQSNGKNRLFGRQKPLHLVLGAGKRADIILWRNKQLTGGIFGGITFMWLCFECVVFVMVLTVPLVYEKNEDVVDNYAEKAWIEIKKQYAVLDDKYLHKLPIFSSLKSHKQH